MKTKYRENSLQKIQRTRKQPRSNIVRHGIVRQCPFKSVPTQRVLRHDRRRDLLCPHAAAIAAAAVPAVPAVSSTCRPSPRTPASRHPSARCTGGLTVRAARQRACALVSCLPLLIPARHVDHESAVDDRASSGSETDANAGCFHRRTHARVSTKRCPTVGRCC